MTYKPMPGPSERRAAPWSQVVQSPTVRLLSVTVALAFAILLILIWPQGALHVRFQTPVSTSETATSLLAASTDPLCKLTYNIPNWEGRDIPTCDISICKGREKLNLVAPPAAGSQQRRWSAFDEATYLKMYEGNQISGWLQVKSMCGERLGQSSQQSSKHRHMKHVPVCSRRCKARERTAPDVWTPDNGPKHSIILRCMHRPLSHT